MANWANSGHSTWGKWEENGTKSETVPFSPFFERSRILPSIPFVKSSSPHSLPEKWEFLPLTDTHHHGGQ